MLKYTFIFLFPFGLITLIGLTFVYGFEQIGEEQITDNKKMIEQSNNCVGNAYCKNELSIQGFDSSSISNQTVTQINECGYEEKQGCTNIAFLNNYIEAAGSATIESTVTQDLYQKCGPEDGLICTNTNDMTVDASAIGSSFLDYVSSQSIQNTTQLK